MKLAAIVPLNSRAQAKTRLARVLRFHRARGALPLAGAGCPRHAAPGAHRRYRRC